MFVYNQISTIYQGIVVAKLPFTPFKIFHGLTHRHLEGDDFTDCSVSFIYLLCSILFSTNIGRYFQFTPKIILPPKWIDPKKNTMEKDNENKKKKKKKKK